MGGAGRCVVAGATGLVGSELVGRLLASPRVSGVEVLARRRAGREDARLKAHLVDFDKPQGFPSLQGEKPLIALFCALGTTLRAAGSAEAFRRVDHDYVLAVARWGAEQGIPRFLLVSAVGADAGSRALYPRVKGEVEASVRALPYRAVHVFRPSFLLGEREEARPGEALGIAAASLLSPLLRGPLGRYRPVPAGAVAAAMLRVALDGPEGFHVHEYDAIHELARGTEP